jgi:hypothetical protein
LATTHQIDHDVVPVVVLYLEEDFRIARRGTLVGGVTS